MESADNAEYLRLPDSNASCFSPLRKQRVSHRYDGHEKDRGKRAKQKKMRARITDAINTMVSDVRACVCVYVCVSE